MTLESSQAPVNKQQDNFSSYFGFLVSAVAASVGLSNIWRFSSEAAQNGGGIYVAVYVFMSFVIGYPIMLAELSMGRSKNQGVFHTFNNRGKWSIVGFVGALTCFLIFCFYNIVAGWVIGYAWSFISGYFSSGSNTLFALSEKKEFVEFFLQIKSGFVGNIIYTFLMMILAVIIIRAGVSEGIEKCAKFLMPIFVVMMIVLIAYSLSLKNALNGISYYLMPRFDGFSLDGVASAVSQSMMSLSVGFGAILTYGGYMSKKDNLRSASFIIVSGDTLVALFAGFFLFAFLGHQGVDFETEKDIIGGGLAFITLPLIFITKFSPLVACILGASFFFLLFFAAITSSVSLLEVPSKYLEDRYKVSRNDSISIVAASSFLISILCILGESKIEWLFSVMPNFQDYNFHSFYQDCAVRVLIPLSVFLYYLFVVREYKVEEILKEAYGDKKQNPLFVSYIKFTVSILWPAASIFGIMHVIYNVFF